MTFERHLRTHALAKPDAPALIMAESGQVTTFAELDERSNRVAHVLRGAGLKIYDHIAILMENGSPFLEVAWAAQRSGLYYTALNSHLRPAEVQHILDDCGAQALFASAALGDVVAALDTSRIGLRVVSDGDIDGFERYEDILAKGLPTPIPDEAEGREMLYSSGTTGVPKGVRKTLTPTELGDPAAIPVALALSMEAMGMIGTATYLTPAPLYHSAPLVYTMAVQRLGTTAVVLEHFDPELCLAAIERHAITHAQFVPTMFTRMLKLPDEKRLAYDHSSLRMVLHAAAPCPVSVKQQMMDWWGPIISEYYSGTEDLGATFIGPDEWLAHPGSVGRPMSETHILDTEGNELGAGQAGTIWFVPQRDFEYHRDPDKTAAITNDRGWRTLGDVGYLDEDGYLFLTDRSTDMIVSGGVNIYPREIEDLLGTHPTVLDVAVFGVPDDEMGESVKAVVQFVDGLADPPSEEELISWCKERSASCKCPRSIDVTDALPRDPSGKLFKRLLRDPYWEGRTSRIV